jgi:hypothetical protein
MPPKETVSFGSKGSSRTVVGSLGASHEDQYASAR